MRHSLFRHVDERGAWRGEASYLPEACEPSPRRSTAAADQQFHTRLPLHQGHAGRLLLWLQGEKQQKAGDCIRGLIVGRAEQGQGCPDIKAWALTGRPRALEHAACQLRLARRGKGPNYTAAVGLLQNGDLACGLQQKEGG